MHTEVNTCVMALRSYPHYHGTKEDSEGSVEDEGRWFQEAREGCLQYIQGGIEPAHTTQTSMLELEHSPQPCLIPWPLNCIDGWVELMRRGFGCSNSHARRGVAHLRRELAPRLEAILPLALACNSPLAAAIATVHTELLKAIKSPKARYDYSDVCINALCLMCNNTATIKSMGREVGLQVDSSNSVAGSQVELEKERREHMQTKRELEETKLLLEMSQQQIAAMQTGQQIPAPPSMDMPSIEALGMMEGWDGWVGLVEAQ